MLVRLTFFKIFPVSSFLLFLWKVSNRQQFKSFLKFLHEAKIRRKIIQFMLAGFRPFLRLLLEIWPGSRYLGFAPRNAYVRLDRLIWVDCLVLFLLPSDWNRILKVWLFIWVEWHRCMRALEACNGLWLELEPTGCFDLCILNAFWLNLSSGIHIFNP